MTEKNGKDLPFGTLPCPICMGQSFKPWRWDGLEACVGCEYVRKMMPPEEGLGQEIQQVYFDKQFALQVDLFTRFYERTNAERRLREVKQFLPVGNVLEVGVGHGSLLSVFGSSGYGVEGIDIAPEVCLAVHDRYRIPMHCSTLEAHAETAAAGTYDIIIMCHVLEHVESPALSLDAVRRLLKRDGLLYVAVPNLRSWNAYLPGWTGYEPYHMHYFCPDSLNQVLGATHFEVVYEKTFEPLSGWFNTLLRSARHRSPDIESSVHFAPGDGNRNGLMWALYNVLRMTIGSVSSPIRWLQSRLGYGEECIMIARPKDLSSRITQTI